MFGKTRGSRDTRGCFKSARRERLLIDSGGAGEGEMRAALTFRWQRRRRRQWTLKSALDTFNGYNECTHRLLHCINIFCCESRKTCKLPW